MSKPTEEELKRALLAAAHMREQGQDPDFIAKALLNLHYRFGFLEEVVSAAEHYLHSGQGEREHSLLVGAIRKYHDAESLTSGEYRKPSWLA